MGPEASDMVVCDPTPEMTEKLKQIMEDIKSGKITVLEG
jgi:basic membrane protein A